MTPQKKEEIKKLLKILSQLSTKEEELLHTYAQRRLGFYEAKEQLKEIRNKSRIFEKKPDENRGRELIALIELFEDKIRGGYSSILTQDVQLNKKFTDYYSKEKKILSLVKPLSVNDYRELHNNFDQLSKGTTQVLNWALKKVKKEIDREDIMISSEEHLREIVGKIRLFHEKIHKMLIELFHSLEGLKSFIQTGTGTLRISIEEVRAAMSKLEKLKEAELTELIEPINKFIRVKKDAEEVLDELLEVRKLNKSKISVSDIKKDLEVLSREDEVTQYLMFLSRQIDKLDTKAQRFLTALYRSSKFKISGYISSSKQALIDGLTRIYNKRAFTKRMRDCAKKASNKGYIISLIFFDIDFFKKFNDNYGHKKGDFVLGEVAAIVKNSIRDNDEVYRYGGEEFVVILPRTDKNHALLVADRINKNMKKPEYNLLNIKTDETEKVRIKVSLGVATFPDDTIETENALEELLSIADERLYKAKQNGRDQVVAKGRFRKAA